MVDSSLDFKEGIPEDLAEGSLVMGHIREPVTLLMEVEERTDKAVFQLSTPPAVAVVVTAVQILLPAL